MLCEYCLGVGGCWWALMMLAGVGRCWQVLAGVSGCWRVLVGVGGQKEKNVK